MSLHDRYFDWCTEYSKKYDTCIVLMMVGSFYEMYSIKNDIETVGADLYSVCDLLGIQLTRKNKSILENSRSNPMMAGFPTGVLDKHVQTLIGAGYTIVLVEQVTPPPNPKREVTQIISPSMTLAPSGSGRDGNYLMVVYVDKVANLVKMGFAICDASTGQTSVYEAHSLDTDVNFAQDELTRLLNSFAPKECVFTGMGDKNIYNVNNVNSGGGGSLSNKIHERWGLDKSYAKPSFQNTLLNRAHPVETASILTPIEALNLERHTHASIAYCYLLEFVREHNETLSSHLTPPEFLDNETHLNLQYNSAIQLNIIGGEKPLMQLLNRCSTAFGSRLFKQRLLAPLISADSINERLVAVDNMLVEKGFIPIRKHLAEVLDLERIRRKIALGTFQPMEWNGFDISLQNALKVITAQDHRDALETTTRGYTSVLSLPAASKYVMTDIRTSIFVKGFDNEIDALETDIQQSLTKLSTIATQLGDAKVEQNDRDGHFINITKKRFQEYTKLNLQNQNYFTSKPISTSSNMLRINSPEIEHESNKLIIAQKKLGAMCYDKYTEFLKSFDTAFGELLGVLTSHIAELDVTATNAFNAVSYGYNRPTVNKNAVSSFTAVGIRHPIIERLQTGLEYTANDISLGSGSSDGAIGMLLYGINAVGKSSLMKSVGLNIVMAQSGMYVACNDLQIVPYNSLFTRIPDGDNLFRGQSTFTVEMTELRNILQRCDEHSLVLGDELCSGTEAVSAISIVAAGVSHLVKKRTTFIFATHLHDLVNEAIFTLPKTVRVCHMHIEIDPETSRIVYYRKLREGSGSSLYGLEVCKAIGLPADFIDAANEVRKSVHKTQSLKKHKTTIATKARSSRYNASVYMNICGVCKSQMATETHHIKYQCDADDNGFVGAVHKNDVSNLVPLCEDCHQKEHMGLIKIKGFVKTSQGRLLDA